MSKNVLKNAKKGKKKLQIKFQNFKTSNKISKNF